MVVKQTFLKSFMLFYVRLSGTSKPGRSHTNLEYAGILPGESVTFLGAGIRSANNESAPAG